MAHEVGEHQGSAGAHPFLDLADAVAGKSDVPDAREVRVDEVGGGADVGDRPGEPGRGIVPDVDRRREARHPFFKRFQGSRHGKHLRPAGEDDIAGIPARDPRRHRHHGVARGPEDIKGLVCAGLFDPGEHFPADGVFQVQRVPGEGAADRGFVAERPEDTESGGRSAGNALPEH